MNQTTQSPSSDDMEDRTPAQSYVSFHPGRKVANPPPHHTREKSPAHTIRISEAPDAHFTLVYNADSKNYTLTTGNAVGELAEFIVFTSNVNIIVDSFAQELRQGVSDPPALILRSDGGDSLEWLGLAELYDATELTNGYHTLVSKSNEDGRGVVILVTPYPIHLVAEIPARVR